MAKSEPVKYFLMGIDSVVNNKPFDYTIADDAKSWDYVVHLSNNRFYMNGRSVAIFYKLKRVPRIDSATEIYNMYGRKAQRDGIWV